MLVRSIRLAACLTLVFAGAGCGGEGTGAECPPGSTLTYDSFGEAFFADYCTSCHSASVSGVARNSAPLGLDYDSVEQIRSNSAAIETQAAGGPDNVYSEMPPVGYAAPSASERLMLGEWLACGLP